MLIQDFYIRKYKWNVKVFYAVNCYYTARIVNELKKVGCSGDNLERAYNNLRSCNLDTGITYSNFRKRETVMVISLTSSADEFQSSWDHEKGHLVKHIAQCFGLDPYGEDQQYLSGEIGKLMFPFARIFLCEHCRNDLEKNFH